MSSQTLPKAFQQECIDNAFSVLSTCLDNIDKIAGTPNEPSSRELIVARSGSLLFEAPTGTGKTLMAGNTVELLSLKYDIVWFWFAPFAGLIGQTRKSIRGEFRNLRVKDPTTDRYVETARSGDVFVTTWQSVAVANKASRKVRQDSETMLSIDVAISRLRSLGFHIGVVIDEAHHSFRGNTQAFSFYQDVLSPDVTILATATPRDRDIEEFVTKTGIAHLSRISVSRSRAVESGLIKKGVKVAVFKATQTGVQSLINFKRTALQCAVTTHSKLKQELSDAGHSVVPLLLVQVDSSPGSVETAVDWLRELGFTGEHQVSTHTADEPDPHLLALAQDERVEVLVFKMAVATGFDAPRAFALVSMRTSRDADFGTQIVGRIMRVDRRLQGAADLPETLQYGYVFLSDNASQEGLTTAAQRMNAVRDELADVTDNVAVVTVGEEGPTAQMTGRDGQTYLFIPVRPDIGESTEQEGRSGTHVSPEVQILEGFNLIGTTHADNGNGGSVTTPGTVVVSPGQYRYPLRTDLSFPRRFRRAIVSSDQTNLLDEVLSLFRFDDALVHTAQQISTKILMELLEIFGNKSDRPKEIQAALAQREIGIQAQLTLISFNEDGLLDIRALHRALGEQLNRELGNRGLPHLEEGQPLRDGVDKILALRPASLKEAIVEATRRHVESQEAADIPEDLCSTRELALSRFNIYGVYPEGLNTWEVAFGELLDADLSGTVLWWHRNPSQKPYSVCTPLPGQIRQNNYYPDFVVGIKGRARPDNILLVETKRVLNDEEGNARAKAQIEHPDYKKVMMLYWEREERWMVVEYDATQDRNVPDRVWRTGLMVAF